jgi:type IV secretory pathway VirB2 component (pilin)
MQRARRLVVAGTLLLLLTMHVSGRAQTTPDETTATDWYSIRLYTGDVTQTPAVVQIVALEWSTDLVGTVDYQTATIFMAQRYMDGVGAKGNPAPTRLPASTTYDQGLAYTNLDVQGLDAAVVALRQDRVMVIATYGQDGHVNTKDVQALAQDVLDSLAHAHADTQIEATALLDDYDQHFKAYEATRDGGLDFGAS